MTTGMIVGVLMVVALFVGIFFVIAKTDGIDAAVQVFLFTAIISAWVIVSAMLITGELP